MSREVLLTRLELLHRNTTEVGSVLDALEQGREGVSQTREAIQTAVFGGLGAFNLDAEGLKEVSDRLAVSDPAAQAAFDAVVEVARGLESRLSRLTTTLKEARTQFEAVANRHVKLGATWRAPVGTATSELKNMIEALQAKGGVEETPEEELWASYSSEIAPKADELFTEYLDLIGGVAIRELGLRIGALEEVCHLDELCALADWHARTELLRCVGWKDDDPALILPARDMRGEAGWPIVRFGFGYWSIWGMPLEGHEFGKVVTRRENAPLGQFADYAKELGSSGLRILIADVIATWAEGPAYACALYFLGLAPNDRVVDPVSGIEITAADRARVVQACLKHQILVDRTETTPEAVSAGTGYLEFVDQIDTQWSDALQAAGAGSSERESLDELPERVAGAFSLKKPFSIDDWTHARDVWKALGTDEKPPENPPVWIRHLMNAAWYARLSENAAPQKSGPEIERLTLTQGISIALPKERRLPKQDGAGGQP